MKPRRSAVPLLGALLVALLFAVWRVQTAQRAAAAAALRAPDAESPRLVALSPGLTETLCMLGLRSHLVGRTPWCDAPPSVADLPCVFADGGRVDMAALAAVRPDFVVLPAPLADSPLHDALEKARIAHLAVKTDPFDELLQGVFELGARFGAGAEAEAWIERVAGTVAAERERVAAAVSAAGRAPRVLFVMGPAGEPAGAVRAAARRSWQGGVLEAVGAVNAVTNEAVGAILPRSAVARLDPDIVLEVAAGAGGTRPAADRDAADEAVLRAWGRDPFPALFTPDWHVLREPWPLRAGAPSVERLAQTVSDAAAGWAARAAR
ncbi:MAG: ABC transporter substrate-binding protein [Kiritimatiellae bacterium]|nr:ABC transporter substrate-binding protein [Kiritimatiellia bacterium]